MAGTLSRSAWLVTRECPACGKVIRGPGWFKHLTACVNALRVKAGLRELSSMRPIDAQAYIEEGMTTPELHGALLDAGLGTYAARLAVSRLSTLIRPPADELGHWVDWYGGRFWCERTKGRGLRFTQVIKAPGIRRSKAEPPSAASASRAPSDRGTEA